ncbi:carboxypeptidase-like regulatory domain-containing protein [Marinilabiliaceae bacterium JC040]|nr:carboxypeptidase-like regulatory domain-containing protein [Marinilabiliaceae bacterium JC040]
MRKVSIIFLILLCSSLVYGQKYTIKGKVIDKTSGLGISFASVWIKGTFVGVATDLEGKYELEVPKDKSDSVLQFSSVGYKDEEFDFNLIKGKKDVLNVSLQSRLFIFNEVNITGKSLVLQKYLKNVCKNIVDNYPQKQFSSDVYYSYNKKIDSTKSETKNSLLRVYDDEGYKRSSVDKTYKSVNYKFLKVDKQSENGFLGGGSTYVDNILYCDIVRSVGNILDINNLSEFMLERYADIDDKGINVIVIGYRLKSNQSDIVNIDGLKSYSGILYINKENFAVIKNILKIQLNKVPNLGLPIVVKSNKVKGNDVILNIETNYKKVGSKYYLSQILYHQQYNKELITIDYRPQEYNLSKPIKVDGREYYEELKADSKYWSIFSINKDLEIK